MSSVPAKSVFVLGATGTIGQATVKSLVADGHEVVCFLRRKPGDLPASIVAHLEGATIRHGDASNPSSLKEDGLKTDQFDAIVSCMASRTGTPKDAWAVDYSAHMTVLAVARDAGIPHMVLLSAICVQKPRLAFQHAKLAFEEALISSGLSYSIVRPTAYFKSLSGQMDRLKKGKPYLLFGDGTLTSCLPISDADLGAYLARCLWDEDLQNRILPIGGPGDPVTPRAQGEYLFSLLGRAPKYQKVPLGMMDIIIGTLSLMGKVIPTLGEKAELAKIGRYYATESMLALDPVTGQYSATATPQTGADTLFQFYDRLAAGDVTLDRGEHAVF
ncbi:MAG: NAD(P)H-binding protein [Pseudomonadota bacterium]